MATWPVGADRPTIDRREFLRQLRGLVVSPAFLVYVALALTMPWWIKAAVYAVVATFLVAPNGWIAWSAVILLGCASLGGIVGFVLVALCDRAARATRAFQKARDRASWIVANAAFRENVRRNLCLLWVALLSLPFLIPASGGFVVGSDSGPLLVKQNGKLRYATKVEGTRLVMKALRSEGLFSHQDFGKHQ